MSPNPAPIAPRRSETLRQLLHPQQLREALTLTHQPKLRTSAVVGAQAAVTGAIALPLFAVSPWSPMIGFAAVGAMVALFGRFLPPRARLGIVLHAGAMQTLGVLAMSAIAWSGAPFAAAYALLALTCGMFFLMAVSRPFGPPGALIFVFGAGAAMVPVADGAEVLARTGATGGVALLALAVVALSDRLRPPQTTPVEPAAALGRRLIAALRVVIATGAAIAASHAAGLQHPAWAAMGALSVMQGAQLHLSANRALQRMAGTIVGAGLAWVLLAPGHSVWVLVAMLVAFNILTELVIGANYGLGQVFVTPMALLTTALAVPQAAAATMAVDRVLETILGALIGLGIAVLFSTLDDRRQLARHHASRHST